MRIGIIDDERPARSELKHQLSELMPVAEFFEADSGAKTLELIEKEALDILFLDINLGDISGTALVNAIKNMQPGLQIVFVTAYSEYAIQAFELGVDDYIMKPFSSKRLQKVVDRLQERKQGQIKMQEEEKNQTPPKRIAINIGSKTIFEDVENIIYIETYNRGCMVYTGTNAYSDSRTIGEYEKKLRGGRFFRIHKSYLINIDKVSEVFPWGNNSFNLRMHGYEKNMLPVSREKLKILRQLLES